MLTRSSRAWRGLVTLLVLGLLVAGSLEGEDDDFPFGPFRMFSTSTKPSGIVTTAELWICTADGRDEMVIAERIGLRRAELEGQLPRLDADPTGLEDVGVAWRRVHPDAAELVEVRLEERVRHLEGSRVVGDERRVKAAWRPGP